MGWAWGGDKRGITSAGGEVGVGGIIWKTWKASKTDGTRVIPPAILAATIAAWSPERAWV